MMSVGVPSSAITLNGGFFPSAISAFICSRMLTRTLQRAAGASPTALENYLALRWGRRSVEAAVAQLRCAFDCEQVSRRSVVEAAMCGKTAMTLIHDPDPKDVREMRVQRGTGEAAHRSRVREDPRRR